MSVTRKATVVGRKRPKKAARENNVFWEFHGAYVPEEATTALDEHNLC